MHPLRSKWDSVDCTAAYYSGSIVARHETHWWLPHPYPALSGPYGMNEHELGHAGKWDIPLYYVPMMVYTLMEQRHKALTVGFIEILKWMIFLLCTLSIIDQLQSKFRYWYISEKDYIILAWCSENHSKTASSTLNELGYTNIYKNRRHQYLVLWKQHHESTAQLQEIVPIQKMFYRAIRSSWINTNWICTA